MRAFLLSTVTASLCLAGGQTAMAADVMTLIQARQSGEAPKPSFPETIPYSYIVDMDLDGAEGDDAAAFTIRYQVNPQAAPGKRVTVLSGELSDYDEDVQKELKKFDEETSEADIAKQFWCVGSSKNAAISPDDITVIREDAREAVLSLNANALSIMMDIDDNDDMPGKIRKRLAGEMSVTKPTLELQSMKVWLTKPTTVKVVAKIKTMEIEQRCDAAPNGVPFVSERRMNVSGKALGSEFRQKMVLKISALQPL